MPSFLSQKQLCNLSLHFWMIGVDWRMTGVEFSHLEFFKVKKKKKNSLKYLTVHSVHSLQGKIIIIKV